MKNEIDDLKRQALIEKEMLTQEHKRDLEEKIVAMDSHTPGGPNTMRFLREKMTFDVVAADE